MRKEILNGPKLSEYDLKLSGGVFDKMITLMVMSELLMMLPQNY